MQAITSILAGKNILIADDYEMNRFTASSILKTYGANITEVENGEEAVKILSEKSFDIVLMDAQMPVMDGFRATIIIRQSISRSLPVIALTALTVDGTCQKCLAAGMNDFLVKPYEEMQLLNMVCGWLKSNEAVLQKAV